MSDEWKPLRECPFCGGEAEFYGNWGCDCCYVHCTRCHARGETIYCDTESEEYEDGDSSKEEAQAIKAWNTRVTDEPVLKTEWQELQAKYDKALAYIKMQANLHITDDELKSYSDPMRSIARQCRELLKELGDE